MRKSLLITSALGLISALPTFAMANAAAGSSAAACGSGFFAQFDAKILNAKLDIKNEKKTKIEDNQKTDDDSIAADIKSKFLAGLSNVEFVGLFDFDIGAGADKARVLGFKAPGAAIGIGAADVNADSLAALTMADLKGAADDAALKLLVDGKLAALNAAAAFVAAPTTDQIKSIVGDLKTLKNLGVSSGLGDGVLVNNILNERADSFGDIEFNSRIFGQDAVTVAQKFTVDAITGAVGTAKANYFGKVNNFYFVTTVNAGPALSEGDVKAAFSDVLTGKVTPAGAVGGKKFAERLDDLAKASPAFSNLINSEKDERTKFNDALEQNRKAGYDVTDRRVHHHALAGGVGATAGWWQNMGGFAVSISGTGDYHWGTFRTVDDAAGTTVEAKNKRKLGFGFQGDVGVHYVVSPSTTLGVLVGLRGQQLQFGRTDKTVTTTSKDSKGDYASKWMWNPVVSAQARTFFTDTVYGALTVGYVIPMSERDYKLENTKIDKDAKVRFQGLTGAFSVGMMF